MATADLDVSHIVDRAIRSELDRRRPELGPLVDVFEERTRQNDKWGEQNHPDLSPELRRTADGVRRFWLHDITRYYGIPSADLAKRLTDEDAALGACSWLAIATEELAEAAEAAADGDEAALRTELIQLAAVCVQWVQAIDRRAQPQSGNPA